MKIAQGVLLVLVVSVLASCKTSAPSVSSLAEYKGRKLEYGSQGGITGGGTTIRILENGQIFSASLTLASETPVDEKSYGQGSAKEALALIKEGAALLKKYPDQNGTGNMTYFLV